jgi:hypothetical protein
VLLHAHRQNAKVEKTLYGDRVRISRALDS